ncbi:MAG: CRISPR-associated protein Cas4 [Promethearchaeati archaeon SRVP18_Atabeyarchaeia-1]
MNITGVMVQYYQACKRELWFFAHQINMNYDDENISIGRLIHEKSFSRERKNITLGEVVFDFVRREGDIKIFEVKKSSRLREPARWQLYYYLWYTKKLGRPLKGEIVYPREKKREELTLTPQIENEIQVILEEIPKIAQNPNPPKAETKRYCKRCSYYALCVV